MRIAAQPSLQGVRVIIFSSSARQADQEAAQAHGADAYFVKPNRLEKWAAMVGELNTSWLSGSGQNSN